MKIYKLSDQVPEKSPHSLTKKHKYDTIKSEAAHPAQAFGDELIITNLKPGVKNPNRVNVFINEKFVFSLDLAQIVDFKLKIGQTITEDDLANYQKASDFGKLYQRALEWVLMRPRSERETKDYLSRKIYEKNLDPGYQEIIFERLKSKNYLDDYKFAQHWVENRFVKKGISRKRLSMELAKKDIDKEIIASVLDSRNDTSEIDKIIARKRAKYDDDKLISYLCRQGFEYQLAQSRVHASGTD